jgi:hypothetical protein
LAGLVPPCWPVNVNAVAEMPMAGGAASVSVAVTVIGELVAPLDEIVIAPVCVPAAIPEMSGTIITLDGADPLDGATESHPTLDAADQFIVPPPVLVMLSAWAAGLDVPCTPLNETEVEVTEIVGGRGGADASVHVRAP